MPDSTKLALNLGLAAGLDCIEWLSFNQTDRLPTTRTGWSAPANQIKLDNNLGYVRDASLVGGFYTDSTLRALIARLGLGANPPKTVGPLANFESNFRINPHLQLAGQALDFPVE